MDLLVDQSCHIIVKRQGGPHEYIIVPGIGASRCLHAGKPTRRSAATAFSEAALGWAGWLASVAQGGRARQAASWPDPQLQPTAAMTPTPPGRQPPAIAASGGPAP